MSDPWKDRLIPKDRKKKDFELSLLQLVFYPKEKQEQVLQLVFPTFIKAFSTIKKLFSLNSEKPKSLAVRADEIERAFGSFTSRGMARRITAKILLQDPDFDLYHPRYESLRLLLDYACEEFLEVFHSLAEQYGQAAASEWAIAVRSGKELFIPSYLEDLILENEPRRA